MKMMRSFSRREKMFVGALAPVGLLDHHGDEGPELRVLNGAALTRIVSVAGIPAAFRGICATFQRDILR
jgi:hypothetical protein